MKKTILLIALLIAAVGSPASAAVISFSPASGTVSGIFTVDVQATSLFTGRNAATDGIISYGFNFAIGDPAILSFIGASSGPLFDPPTTQPGTDVFGAASGLGIFDPVTEPLLLATLTFQVIGVGPVSIVFSTADIDTNFFQGLQYLESPFQEPISGTVSLTAVPEPATIAFAGLALAVLAVARRTRAAR